MTANETFFSRRQAPPCTYNRRTGGRVQPRVRYCINAMPGTECRIRLGIARLDKTKALDETPRGGIDAQTEGSP
jgi:hypothetical protein